MKRLQLDSKEEQKINQQLVVDIDTSRRFFQNQIIYFT